MNKKLCIYSGIFAALCGTLFVSSMFINRAGFERIAYDSVFSYQMRQLAALLLILLLGLLCQFTVNTMLSPQWSVLFALPTGICLWVFAGILLLLTGVPFTFPATMAVVLVMLCLFYGLRRYFLPGKNRSVSTTESLKKALPLLLFFLGLVFFAASGFTYSFVSYDSFFYFINYGHTLTILGNFRDIAGENSFTLTNISQFLPLVHAYAAFWGLDQAYQIQALLSCNVLAAFFYGLYRFSAVIPVSAGEGIPALPRKKALLFSALFTFLLASSTCFIVASSWVLANMYCMVYIFFLFLASLLLQHGECARYEGMILIAANFTALTLLRKDGIIFAAFFLICFSSIRLLSKKHLALLFLPPSLAEIWWLFYVRVILDAGVSQAVYTSIANNKNIFFIGLILAGSYAYLLFGHDLLKRIEKLTPRLPFLTEYSMILAGMFVLLCYSFVLKGDIIIDNMDFVIRNMFRYPSSWGISALFFGVLIVWSVTVRIRLDYMHFLWIGYAFLNFVSYCIVDSKAFWLNWDDSYNRVLQQIVPVFVLIMALKSLALLQSDTPDHSSES